MTGPTMDPMALDPAIHETNVTSRYSTRRLPGRANMLFFYTCSLRTQKISCCTCFTNTPSNHRVHETKGFGLVRSIQVCPGYY